MAFAAEHSNLLLVKYFHTHLIKLFAVSEIEIGIEAKKKSWERARERERERAIQTWAKCWAVLCFIRFFFSSLSFFIETIICNNKMCHSTVYVERWERCGNKINGIHFYCINIDQCVYKCTNRHNNRSRKTRKNGGARARSIGCHLYLFPISILYNHTRAHHLQFCMSFKCHDLPPSCSHTAFNLYLSNESDTQRWIELHESCERRWGSFEKTF